MMLIQPLAEEEAMFLEIRRKAQVGNILHINTQTRPKTSSRGSYRSFMARHQDRQ